MTIVVNIYEQYGKAVALTFAKAIKELRHFSKVVKEAGKGNKSLPPISIIPENFGYLLRNRKNVEVIWPQDGSPVFPLLMTVKKEKADQMKELIDYLSGLELGQYWGDSHFASFNQNVENKAYQGKPIRYLGWDFVYDKDILEFRESLEEEVLEIVRGYPMDKKEKVQRIC